MLQSLLVLGVRLWWFSRRLMSGYGQRVSQIHLVEERCQ